MARQPLWSCCLQWRSTGNGAALTRCVWALLGHLLHGRVVRAVLPGCVAASRPYGVPGELHASTLASTLAFFLPRAGARCGDSCADAAPRIRCAADLKVCKAAQLAAEYGFGASLQSCMGGRGRAGGFMPGVQVGMRSRLSTSPHPANSLQPRWPPAARWSQWRQSVPAHLLFSH